MSLGLQGVEMNYPEVDKHAYDVFKEINYLHFIPYLLKYRTKVMVLYFAVRNLLVKKYLGEKRARWMNTLQEYDLEINPAKIVKV
jgi:hypothetical protein